MGIQRGQDEWETSPSPPPPPHFWIWKKKRKEKQILNYKKYVNKITLT